jgi:hypothetical protein
VYGYARQMEFAANGLSITPNLRLSGAVGNSLYTGVEFYGVPPERGIKPPRYRRKTP